MQGDKNNQKMKKLILISFIFLSTFVYGQNEVDAFRFSQFYWEGTARSMAMGNAFSAIGADVSSANMNPAGIGLLKHSEFVISPSVLMSNTSSDFNGSTSAGDNLSMMFSNLSFATGFRDDANDLKAVNFSFGYNRYNNFKNNINIQGVNNKGSMLDYFMLEANGSTPEYLNSYTSYNAWNTWLISQVDSGSLDYTNELWYSASPNAPQYGETQSRIQQIKGGAGEYFLNGAINYKDFLYIGATLGLQSFNYSYKIQHEESNFLDPTDLNSFTYTENLRDEGSGVNFKAGIILVPVKFIRLGANFHSPTYMTINDRFSTVVQSFWDTADDYGNYNYSSESPQNSYTYNLTTPMRVSGNLGLIISQYALIGFDYEYVDYSAMRMSASDYMFQDENENIQNNFQATNNIRAGAEINLGAIKLRGGYAMFGNPYTNKDFSKTQISGGIGITSNSMFFDIAYVHDVKKYSYYMYNGYVDEPVPEITVKNGILNMTLGFKF